jgi:hypothetical protein
MIAHMTVGMQTLLTITLLQISNALYIASCLLVSILMNILNINNRTRYSNTWLKPQQYNKLQMSRQSFTQSNLHGNRMDTREDREHKQQGLNA